MFVEIDSISPIYAFQNHSNTYYEISNELLLIHQIKHKETVIFRNPFQQLFTSFAVNLRVVEHVPG